MEKESLYHFASKKIYNQNIVFLVFEKNILSKIVVKSLLMQKIIIIYINGFYHLFICIFNY